MINRTKIVLLFDCLAQHLAHIIYFGELNPLGSVDFRPIEGGFEGKEIPQRGDAGNVRAYSFKT